MQVVLHKVTFSSTPFTSGTHAGNYSVQVIAMQQSSSSLPAVVASSSPTAPTSLDVVANDATKKSVATLTFSTMSTGGGSGGLFKSSASPASTSGVLFKTKDPPSDGASPAPIDAVELKITFDASAPLPLPHPPPSDAVVVLEELQPPLPPSGSAALPKARIVVHRVENARTRRNLEANVGAVEDDLRPFPEGDGGGAPTAPMRGERAMMNASTDIYPLLDDAYDEVGSVELQIVWPRDEEDAGSKAVGSNCDDGNINLTATNSYTLDDYHFQDPMALLRKSWSKNKAWMNDLTAASAAGQLLSSPSDPNFLTQPPPPPFSSRSSSSGPSSPSTKGRRSHLPPASLSSRRAAPSLPLPPPVAFDVDVSRPRSAPLPPDRAPRVVERRFLARREAEWDRLRTEKEAKLQKIREEKKRVKDARNLTMQHPVSSNDSIAKRAEDKKQLLLAKRKALSKRVAGRVARMNVAASNGGGLRDKKDDKEVKRVSGTLFFRNTLLGVYPIVDRVRTKVEVQAKARESGGPRLKRGGASAKKPEAVTHAPPPPPPSSSTTTTTTTTAAVDAEPLNGKKKYVTKDAVHTPGSTSKRLEAVRRRAQDLREQEARIAAEVEKKLNDSVKLKAQEERRAKVVAERVEKAKKLNAAVVASAKKRNEEEKKASETMSQTPITARKGRAAGTPGTPSNSLGVGPPIDTPARSGDERGGDGKIPTPVTNVQLGKRRAAAVLTSPQPTTVVMEGEKHKEMATEAAINIAGYAWKINPKSAADGTPEFTLTPVGKIEKKWGGGVKTTLSKEWTEKPKGVEASTKKVTFGKEMTPPSSKYGAVKLKVRTTPAKTPKDGSKKGGRKLVIVLTDDNKEDATTRIEDARKAEEASKISLPRSDSNSQTAVSSSPPAVLQQSGAADEAPAELVAETAQGAGSEDEVDVAVNLGEGGFFEIGPDEDATEGAEEGIGEHVATAFALSDEEDEN